MAPEWPINQLAKLAGTTSRTLRHYGDVGLLEPSRIGANGYRYYDDAALVRLQRILLLRELGLSLDTIADVLAGEQDRTQALHAHLGWLEQEQDRLGRQIASVRKTIDRLEGGEQLMAEEALDGFDHTQYKDEVIERWGKDAYTKSDAWFRSLTDAEKRGFQQEHEDIARDFGEALKAGTAADDDSVQAIVQRQYDWLSIGSKAWMGTAPSKQYFLGLAEMYVADPRFAKNYDKYAEGGAEFVREAMKVYAERNL